MVEEQQNAKTVDEVLRGEKKQKQDVADIQLVSDNLLAIAHMDGLHIPQIPADLAATSSKLARALQKGGGADQPHPMLLRLAIAGKFRTTNKALMKLLLNYYRGDLLHSVDFDGSTNFEYRLNESIESCLRHEAALMHADNVELGAFPLSLSNLVGAELRHVLAFRLAVFVPMREALRNVLWDETNVVKSLPRGLHGVSITLNLLRLFLGPEMFLSGVAEAHVLVFKVADPTRLNHMFPPSQADVASDDEVHEFFNNHSLSERWFMHMIPEYDSATTVRLQFTTVSICFNTKANSMYLRAVKKFEYKRRSGGVHAGWELGVAETLVAQLRASRLRAEAEEAKAGAGAGAGAE